MMVDEKDEHYEDEEEEYHFSDEQLNFDVEPESSKEETEVVRPSSKETFFSKLKDLTPRRRAIIAGVIFIILMGVVYQMLKPAKTTNPVNVASELKPVSAPVVEKPSTPTLAPTKQPLTSTPQQTLVEGAGVAETPTQPPMMGTVTVNTPQGAGTPTPAAAVQPAPPVLPVEIPQNIQERLTTLEQQNAAIMNLLQTEYAQKISDYEMENNMLRTKIDEMSKKISRIESKMSESPQGVAPMVRAPVVETPGPSGRAEPRVAYTVQAIIPGRAWLKSESGDTVTVAEGDILRGYGRIVKIDPYDGVVDIDTGTKVITLSYGMNAE